MGSHNFFCSSSTFFQTAIPSSSCPPPGSGLSAVRAASSPWGAALALMLARSVAFFSPPPQ
jgi:hypothetical protein